MKTLLLAGVAMFALTASAMDAKAGNDIEINGKVLEISRSATKFKSYTDSNTLTTRAAAGTDATGFSQHTASAVSTDGNPAIAGSNSTAYAVGAAAALQLDIEGDIDLPSNVDVEFDRNTPVAISGAVAGGTGAGVAWGDDLSVATSNTAGVASQYTDVERLEVDYSEKVKEYTETGSFDLTKFEVEIELPNNNVIYLAD